MAYEYWYAFITSGIVFGLTIVAFYKYRFTYWRRRGVFSFPASIPYGNIAEFVRQQETIGDTQQKLYKKAKAKGLPFIGYYVCASPVFLPIDRKLIKHILQIDFQNFHTKKMYVNEKDDPLSSHLLSLDGEKWKILRQKINPAFTSYQLKRMFPMIMKVGHKLELIMDKHCHGDIFNAKDIISRFTTDVVALCVFGIESNALENSEEIFRYYGVKALQLTTTKLLKEVLFMSVPHNILRNLRIKVWPDEIRKYFVTTVKTIADHREKTNTHRTDFIHLLLQLKNRGRLVDDGSVVGDNTGPFTITMNELAAQSFLFYIAGFESSATTTSFALFELAANPHLQEKVRKEISKVLNKHNGKLTYEAVMEMTYVKQCIEGN